MNKKRPVRLFMKNIIIVQKNAAKNKYGKINANKLKKETDEGGI